MFANKFPILILDHCLLPAMGYLHLVRESLVRMTPGTTLDTMNVKFENIKWLQATTLTANTPIRLTINIQRGDGHFEITENKILIVSGIVKIMRLTDPVTSLNVPNSSSVQTLNSHDFYKELRLRGYTYDGDFRAVQNARIDGRYGSIAWKNNNWVTFMDGMLQVGVLSKDSRSLQLPTGIRQIKINAVDHLNYLKALQAEQGNDEVITCDVHMSHELNTVVCGGIEITGLTTNPVARRQQNGYTVTDRYEFVPLNGEASVHTIDDAVRICTQLIHETLQTNQISIIEVLDQDSVAIETLESQPIIENFQQALFKMPMVHADLVLLTQRSFPDLSEIDVRSNTKLPTSGDSTAIIAWKCMMDVEFTAAAETNLIENGFLISIESNSTKWTELKAPNGFQLLSLVRSEAISLVLMQRLPSEAVEKVKNVTIHIESSVDDDYKWLKSLQDALATLSTPITLLARGDATSGVLGFVNCLRREKSGRKIQLVHIDENNVPCAAQLKLGLPINIYQNGCWGTYRHLNMLPNVSVGDMQKQSLRVNIRKIGDLSSLIWLPVPCTKDYINIHYAALNFRDVMLASGRLSIDAISLNRRRCDKFLGIEYAGVTASGERVMSMSDGGAMATRISIDEAITLWKVPDHMSLREAATIPCVYTTVYYAFFVGRQIAAGQSILIHAGTGGIGLAAIRVALSYGLQVFTTVSSKKKRVFLLGEFPDLKGACTRGHWAMNNG